MYHIGYGAIHVSGLYFVVARPIVYMYSFTLQYYSTETVGRIDGMFQNGYRAVCIGMNSTVVFIVRIRMPRYFTSTS